MKKCKSCQSDIDAKAKRCPKCQADQRGWFRRHPILTGLLGIFILGIIITVVSSGSKSGSSSSTTTANSDSSANSKPVAKPTPLVIDGTTLVGAYDTNKLNAQDKYTGKFIQTTGYIANISSDITGSYYLSLNPSNDQYYAGTTIQCYFNDKGPLTSLSNGQSVTVQGTMQDMSLGIVEMKDCNVVK